MHSFAKVMLASALLVAIVNAGYIDLSGHGHDQGHYEEQGHHEEVALDYHAEPKYSFTYAVNDPHTGDQKQHVEERDGDVVKGQYTFKEADGTTRVVNYHADNHNGFNAVVHKIGEPKHEETHYEDHAQHY